jgi:uncharacterized SAM-binding protein YcdF (DUF218 family)
MGFLFFPAAAAGVGFLIWFAVLYAHSPDRLLTGFALDLCLIDALTIAGVWLLQQGNNGNRLAVLLVVLIGCALLILLLCGGYILVGSLYYHAVQLFRRERHSLQNCLSLLVAVALTAQFLLLVFASSWLKNPIVLLVWGLLCVLEGYLVLTVLSFVTAAWLCKLRRPSPRTDCLIVLGSGLLRGNEVSPLLAGRIDCALHFYQKARAKGRQPLLVFSGGQGSDETVPEGAAMRAYAVSHGADPADLLVEKQSRNTLENLQNSRTLVAAQAPQCRRFAVVTSDYHLLRACQYARQAGFRRICGLGARTVRYYASNASIREYIAMMLLSRRANLRAVALLSAVYLVAASIFLFA